MPTARIRRAMRQDDSEEVQRLADRATRTGTTTGVTSTSTSSPGTSTSTSSPGTNSSRSSSSEPSNDFSEEFANIQEQINQRDEAFNSFAQEFSTALSDLSTGLVERQDSMFAALQQQQQGLAEVLFQQDEQRQSGSISPVIVAAAVGVSALLIGFGGSS